MIAQPEPVFEGPAPRPTPCRKPQKSNPAARTKSTSGAGQMPNTTVTATVTKIATAVGAGTLTGPRLTLARPRRRPARSRRADPALERQATASPRRSPVPAGEPDAVHEEDEAQVERGGDGRRQHGDDRERVRVGPHRGRHDVELGQEARRERDPRLAEEQHGEGERQQRAGDGRGRGRRRGRGRGRPGRRRR